MSDKVIKVGLMGLGTVGTGVYKVMENQKVSFRIKSVQIWKLTKIWCVKMLSKMPSHVYVVTFKSLAAMKIS